MKIRPITRALLAFILLLLAAGVFFLIVTFNIFKDFKHLFDIRQVDIEADLSKPGEFACDFIQTRKSHLGQTVFLYIPSDNLSPDNLLESLEFECKITDPNGNIVIDSNMAGRSRWHNRSYDISIPLMSLLNPLEPGDYRFTFTVTKGAPKLNGLEQRIVCKHLLCGCMILPAVFTFCLAIGSFLSAGIIILIVFIKKRKKVNQITMT
ncbi:MAG: hypothetical protein ACYSWP_11025 [Planctomycetota bacterium]|jgi:hypothetical protein